MVAMKSISDDKAERKALKAAAKAEKEAKKALKEVSKKRKQEESEPAGRSS